MNAPTHDHAVEIPVGAGHRLSGRPMDGLGLVWVFVRGFRSGIEGRESRALDDVESILVFDAIALTCDRIDALWLPAGDRP
jgi:hypothetical protein